MTRNRKLEIERYMFLAFFTDRFFICSVVFFPDMGNESTKSKSTKPQEPLTVVARREAAQNTKHVLILYKAWSKRAGEIMEYFYDALNQVSPLGGVEISSKNVLDVSQHNDEYIRNRTSQWLVSMNNVVLLCFAVTQPEQFAREDFTDDSGKLPSKFFPLVFGTEIPSQWPECYSLGIDDPEKVQRPNDFESAGLKVLMAAIRATSQRSLLQA